MTGKESGRWTSTVIRAVVVLVATAVGGRLVWILLEPAVPDLLAVLGLIGVFATLRGWLRR